MEQLSFFFSLFLPTSLLCNLDINSITISCFFFKLYHLLSTSKIVSENWWHLNCFFSPVISALLAVTRRKVGTSRDCNIIGTCDYLRCLSIWISCVLTSIAGIARFPFLSIVIFKSLNTIVCTVCSARIYRFERKVFLFFLARNHQEPRVSVGDPSRDHR